MSFGKRWFGRLMALPVMVLCGIINVLEDIQNAQLLTQLGNLSILLSAGLLLALMAGLLLFTQRFYPHLPRITCWLFVLVAVVVDYLIAGLCQHWLDSSRDPQDLEHLFNNMDFVVVLPLMLLALLLWGWAFDRVKNRAAQGLM